MGGNGTVIVILQEREKHSFYNLIVYIMLISAGILSHYAPKTLRYTLETYKTCGMFDLIGDLFIVLQQSTRQCEEIEEKHICQL
jgi:hypothetical protein